jgi:AcrR family transcriptional regulator
MSKRVITDEMLERMKGMEGLKAKEIAAELGVKTTTIYTYMRGKQVVMPKFIEQKEDKGDIFNVYERENWLI